MFRGLPSVSFLPAVALVLPVPPAPNTHLFVFSKGLYTETRFCLFATEYSIAKLAMLYIQEKAPITPMPRKAGEIPNKFKVYARHAQWIPVTRIVGQLVSFQSFYRLVSLITTQFSVSCPSRVPVLRPVRTRARGPWATRGAPSS